ncbi:MULTISPECIES: fasciclin domain-containing protein [unclassified Sphingomonas]|uniref:fasciclin domain-containing protein n=1 Tax=unclassified Sphingomonas TaxID=196159 RepID=UPI0022698BBD|nr:MULTISPECIES: fasciclin domain-containing protein [unclassified Sphingomonas]
MKSLSRLGIVAATLSLAGCVAPGDAPPSPAPRSLPAATPAGSPADDAERMLPDATILANVAIAPSLATLSGAIRAAGLGATLSGSTPVTLFAPSNPAFGRFGPGVLERLMQPANRPALIALLRYHLVAGRLSAQDLMARIAAGGGTTTLTTLAGQPITATLTGQVITLTSVTGNRSYVEVGDLAQANGVIHIVNGVLVPTLP